MGQASRRGTFEERKAQSIARKEEQRRIDKEAFLLRQAERDALMDRDYTPPAQSDTGRRVGVIGHVGRRGSSMMLMAAMLAATAGIGVIDIPSGRKYR